MASPDKRLGRGLDALFRHTEAPLKSNESTKLSLRAMAPNPDQPRKHFSNEALEELAASIKEHGVLQPILVRPWPQKNASTPAVLSNQPAYQIIAGERRWKASKLAGLLEVPVIVRDFDNKETLAVALIENLQRENLNPMEEAKALVHLRETFSLSQEELARQLGKSRSAIANSMRLIQLPESMHDDMANGTLSAGHARALLAITDTTVQHALRNQIIQFALTVREAEEAASHWKAFGHLPSHEALKQEAEQSASPIASSTNSTGITDAMAEPAVAPCARSPRRKAPAVKLLQKRLTEHLSLKTSISGTENKGKITLSYANADDLQRIIDVLGLPQDEA